MGGLSTSRGRAGADWCSNQAIDGGMVKSWSHLIGVTVDLPRGPNDEAETGPCVDVTPTPS
jgi:hypothetical protein